MLPQLPVLPDPVLQRGALLVELLQLRLQHVLHLQLLW